MEFPVGNVTSPKRKRKLWAGMSLHFLMFGSGVVSAGIWLFVALPSSERVVPFDGRKHVIVFQGKCKQYHSWRSGEVLCRFIYSEAYGSQYFGTSRPVP